MLPPPCFSEARVQAFPPAKFFWQFENGTRTRSGPDLEWRSPVRRTDGGTYTCTAFNEHGNTKDTGMETHINNNDCISTLTLAKYGPKHSFHTEIVRRSQMKRKDLQWVH